jgi:anti-sigma regulatory factor (Ser/Thr protein kinase)
VTWPLRWRLVARGEERQLAALRRWACGLLPACPARDDVVMVANELASNAIRHTASGQGGWFAAEITWQPGLVRVAVADCGGPKEPVVIEDPNGESGRGLFLVRQLSASMGMSGNHHGRLLWADVAWTDLCRGETRACS